MKYIYTDGEKLGAALKILIGIDEPMDSSALEDAIFATPSQPVKEIAIAVIVELFQELQAEIEQLKWGDDE
jgi:hypothetical protein